MSMKKIKPILGAIFALLIAPTAQAAIIGIGDATTAAGASERTELVATLEGLGHTVTNVIDPSLDLIVSAPGVDTATAGTVPYLQIGPTGSTSFAINTAFAWAGTPVTVELTTAHPIFGGVGSTWTTNGAYSYGSTWLDLVGYSATDSYANATFNGTTYTGALAVSGTEMFVGWNIFGSLATTQDLRILDNSIQFLTTGSVTVAPVPLPAGIVLLLTALSALGLARFKRRNVVEATPA